MRLWRRLWRRLCDWLIPEPPEPPVQQVARPKGPYSPTIYSEVQWEAYLADGQPAWEYE
jgi:hypothetical protein